MCRCPSITARPAPRTRRRGGGDDRPILPQRAGTKPEDSGRIGDAGAHLFLVRPSVTKGLQPQRQSRATTARVDDEVGLHGLFGAAVGAGNQPGADHPAAVRRAHQPEDVAPVSEDDSRQRAHPVPDVGFQTGPAGAKDHHAARRLCETVSAEVQPRVTKLIHRRYTASGQVVGEPWEELVEGLLPTGDQAVDVPALWHPAARFG
jgi:hypothetical protein